MTEDLERRVGEKLRAIEEQLAALEHERWSHWQSYMHSQCEPQSDGSLRIPPALVERWTRQMTTRFDRLSANEKESDREQVRRYLPVILSALKEG